MSIVKSNIIGKHHIFNELIRSTFVLVDITLLQLYLGIMLSLHLVHRNVEQIQTLEYDYYLIYRMPLLPSCSFQSHLR